MKEPLDMLSNKDVLYTIDILGVTLTFIKKFNCYKEFISDDTILKKVTSITNILTKQYESLLEELAWKK